MTSSGRPASVEIGRLLGIENIFHDDPGRLWQVAPEALRLRPEVSPASGDAGPGDLGLGRVTDIIDLGRTTEVVVALTGDIELRARTAEIPDLQIGDGCRVTADPDAVSTWKGAGDAERRHLAGGLTTLSCWEHEHPGTWLQPTWTRSR